MEDQQAELDQGASNKARGWDQKYEKYTCRDDKPVSVPRRTALVRIRDEQRELPSNCVRYVRNYFGWLRSMITVSGNAFDRCMQTLSGGSDRGRTLAFPPTVRDVEERVFYKSQALLSVTLNEGLEELGTQERMEDSQTFSGAFRESALKSVHLPSTLKAIRCGVFVSCTNLKSVEFPEGLEAIRLGAFAGSGLQNVKFPASLRTIAQDVFSECKSLRTVTFSEGLEVLEGLERIGDCCFYESALENVTLPSTLKAIWYRAFKSCCALKKVQLPEGLEYIGYECFYGSGITELVIPKSLEEMGWYAFQGCAALKKVQFQVGSKLETLIISCFQGSALKEIIIPKSLRNIGENAFRNCQRLRKVTFEEGSVLKNIGKDAFYNCSNLKSIRLPNSLESIGAHAFCGSGLQEVRIPEAGVVAAEGAFGSCPAKDSVVFRDGMVFQKNQ